MAHEQHPNLILPQSVVGLVDVGRLRRELNAIDDFMIQSSVRNPGKQPTLPKSSKSLDELAKSNKLNLLVEEDRARIELFLKYLRNSAPIIHMSFTSEPSAAVLNKIVTWLRNEIDSQVLLQVGLQPGLAAGCIVRTSNKYFDFSLRQHFTDKKQLLINKISAVEAS